MTKGFRSMIPFGQRNPLGLFDDLHDLDWGFFNSAPWGKEIRVDIQETEKEIVVEAELPGIKKEDIEITFNDNYLTLKAKRSEEKEEKKENYLRKERRSGTLMRSFMLPTEIIEEDIKAKFDNGVLEIHLPKKEPSKSEKRQITLE